MILTLKEKRERIIFHIHALEKEPKTCKPEKRENIINRMMTPHDALYWIDKEINGEL